MVYFYPEIFLNRHKEEQFLKSTNIEIDSLDILQELFGINDKLIKVIENRLGVSITQRNSCITVSGTNDGGYIQL